jgi:uncharacterized membrane protein YfcA
MVHSTVEGKYIPEKTDAALPPPLTSGLIGFAGGIVGGLIGGGVVTIPALDHVTALPRARIHGTSAMVNAVIAMIGAGIYSWHGGAMDLRTGIGLMCGGLIGAPLGARLTARIPELLFRLLFMVVLLFSGGKMLLNAAVPGDQSTAVLLPATQMTHPILLMLLAFLLGALIGVWSSSMGLGGGILAIPTLVLIFGVNQHTAAGTSLLIMIPNTIVGSFAHLRQGTASLRLGSIIGIGAFFGAAIGTWIALMMNNQVLQLIFGCFILFMAIREGYALYCRLCSRLRTPV